jgi:hypothetical protein
MTNRTAAIRRRFWPVGRNRARITTTPVSVTPATTRRSLDRLRSVGSARRIWLLGPDFRPKTVALRRLG